MGKKIFWGIITIVCVFSMVLLFSTDVYATSRTTTTEATGIGRTADEAINSNAQVLGARRNSVDGDGITIGSISDKNVIDSLSDLEKFAKIISDYTKKEVKANELSILDSMDITEAPGTVVSVDNPLFISFSFPGIVSTSEVYIFHYTAEGWKLVPGTVVDGKITGQFSGLSPVAIVAKTSTLKGAVLGAKRAKSPRTGDYRFYLVAACAVFVGTVFAIRKRIIHE